jgi:hypothetical protein
MSVWQVGNLAVEPTKTPGKIAAILREFSYSNVLSRTVKFSMCEYIGVEGEFGMKSCVNSHIENMDSEHEL